MKKILFGITSLTLGGAERVLVDLANRIKDDYAVSILTVYANGDLESQLDKSIEVKSIFPKRFDEYSKLEIFKNSRQLMKKKQLPEGYDLYVSFLEGPMTRLFAKDNNTDAKKIVWVHNDISKVFGKGYKAKMKLKNDLKAYEKYDEIVFVSDENLEDFKQTYPQIDSKKLKVIRNYIDYKKVVEKAKEKVNDIEIKEDKINLVSVCRLVDQKALDRFAAVHRRLLNDGLDHQVFVVGEGPARETLEDLIEKLNIKDSFKLLGSRQNPYPYIKQADYFCLLSYYEGWGMVLDEAKILNKNILITDTAAKECVKNYSKAQVFENTEDGVYEGLKSVLQNAKKEKQSTNENIDEIAKYYEDIAIQIETMFNEKIK
jgi:glycosyltransferase involved in cell wall biosynthesis